MKIKSHLSFNSLRQALSDRSHEFEDSRQSQKVNYSMPDCVLSAFACMYLQSPSLLSFQREMEGRMSQNNLKNLFGVTSIPKETCLRETLDRLPWDSFRPLFKDYLRRLRRGKHLELYRVLGKYYYTPMDGTTFFSSRKIRCKKCLEYHINELEPNCRHQALQAVIVCPGIKQVLPLMPEAILNEDGSNKQDCEINAAKRLVGHLQEDYPQLPFLFGGDGLYSKQPFIKQILDSGGHYLFVAKPKDHQFLFQWVEEIEELPTFQFKDSKGRTHFYQWYNQVPLNAKEKTIETNWIRYKMIKNTPKGDKVVYQNTWVTDLAITRHNVKELVDCGRARWKVENECFNTLKNQGYNLEHNYGHGEQNLCVNFYILILLAFFFHQILELTDRLYQEVRKELTTLYRFWDYVRGWFNRVLFIQWEHILEIILKPPEFIYDGQKIKQGRG